MFLLAQGSAPSFNISWRFSYFLASYDTTTRVQQISLERSESKSGLIDMKENSLYPIGDMSMPTYFGKVFIAHLVKAYNTRFSGNNYIPMENIFCRFFLWMLPCRE